MDSLLATNFASNRRIASRYSLTEAAIRRHKSLHLSARLAKAAKAREIVDAGTVLDRLKLAHEEAWEILAEARQAGDIEIRLKALARIERQLELEGRLIGELRDGQTINLVLSPDWQRTRLAILEALAPYDDARRAVQKALRQASS
ncbi:MAG: hypothetical protein HY650_05600 [Acidobacteria bacterium]|nr:hypothetical protein [Acidobacteriota bacterium]